MKDSTFSISHLACACCFGLALGFVMGYQLVEQTTPAAEVAQMTHSNTNKINELIAWRDKYAKTIVIKPTVEYVCLDCKPN
jgi:hypothetical protein